jgi:hypothetical protein
MDNTQSRKDELELYKYLDTMTSVPNCSMFRKAEHTTFRDPLEYKLHIPNSYYSGGMFRLPFLQTSLAIVWT